MLDILLLIHSGYNPSTERYEFNQQTINILIEEIKRLQEIEWMYNDLS